MRHMIIVAGLILFLSVPAHGTIYLIRPDGTGDFPNIQAAIDAVVDGDIIALAEGTFMGPGNRDLNYLGKAITVMSQGGAPDACIIDCQGYPGVPRRGFSFCSGEGAGSRFVAVETGRATSQASMARSDRGRQSCNTRCAPWSWMTSSR